MQGINLLECLRAIIWNDSNVSEKFDIRSNGSSVRKFHELVSKIDILYILVQCDFNF